MKTRYVMLTIEIYLSVLSSQYYKITQSVSVSGDSCIFITLMVMITFPVQS